MRLRTRPPLLTYLLPLHRGKQHWGPSEYQMAVYMDCSQVVSPNTPASNRAIILDVPVPRTGTYAEVGTRGVVQSWIPTPKQ